MKITHTHVTVKSRGGRPSDPYKRCISCRYTTGSKTRKDFISCPLGNCEGGRLCTGCKALIPPGTEQNCHTWYKILSSDSACRICLKPTNDLANCAVCERPACVSCCLKESWDLFCNTGKEAVICRPCIPPAAFVPPKGVPNYCIMCSGSHPTDGSIPRCQDPNFKGTRLANNLRASLHFDANSTKEFKSASSIAMSARSCHSLALPNSLTLVEENFIPPPENFNLSDFERTFTDRNPAATAEFERKQNLIHGPMDSTLMPKNPNPASSEKNLFDWNPAVTRKFDHELKAPAPGPINTNLGNFSLTNHSIDEARVSSMITQSLLPISNQLLAVSAGIRSLETNLQRLNKTPSDSGYSELPNTICTQTSTFDRSQAKLAFEGKLEPLSCLAFEQGINNLAESLSKLLKPALHDAIPSGRAIVDNLEKTNTNFGAHKNNQVFDDVSDHLQTRRKRCDACGEDFSARQPFHNFCQSCFRERGNGRRPRRFGKRF